MRGATRKEWLGIGGMMLCCASIVVWPTLAESPVLKRLVPLSAADQKLIDAVKNDDLQAVKLALAEGADVNCQDRTRFRSCTSTPPPTYYTPLMLSTFDPLKKKMARAGKPKDESIMKLLLAKGADPNMMGNGSYSPLGMAAISDNKTEVSLLLKAGAEVDLTADGRDTPFSRCVYSGKLEMAKLLYAHGANINSEGEFEQTVLHNCIGYGNSVEKAKWLISKGALLNDTDRRGGTPLHRAIKYGDYKLAEVLVRAGAETNIKDKDGRTVYDLAQQYSSSIVGRANYTPKFSKETPAQVQAKLIDVLERHGKTPTPQTNHA